MWLDDNPLAARSIHIFANRAAHKASAAPENTAFHELKGAMPKEWLTAPLVYELGSMKATAGCYHTRTSEASS